MRGFPQSLQSHIGRVPRMGLDGFLPNPFAVVINQLSYHRRSNGLDTVSVVKDTIKKILRQINHGYYKQRKKSISSSYYYNSGNTNCAVMVRQHLRQHCRAWGLNTALKASKHQQQIASVCANADRKTNDARKTKYRHCTYTVLQKPYCSCTVVENYL